MTERQEQGAANATIGNELNALTRAYSLGIKARLVTHRPSSKAPKVCKARVGFFEVAQRSRSPASASSPRQK